MSTACEPESVVRERETSADAPYAPICARRPAFCARLLANCSVSLYVAEYLLFDVDEPTFTWSA